MAHAPEQEDPRERLRIPITTNAIADASRFCVEQCGFIGEAQEMAVMATAMMGGGTAAVSWEGDTVPEVQTEGQRPNIVMTCKGPRKKFLVFGEYVCRGAAKVDTE